MAAKIMLAPNPSRQMKIDKVIILGQNQDGTILQVLSIDMLEKSPTLMKPYGSGYVLAAAVYNYAGVGLSLASIVASFIWNWWLFIPGCIVGSVIFTVTQISTADFALEILRNNPTAFSYFASKGVIWQVRPDGIATR